MGDEVFNCKQKSRLKTRSAEKAGATALLYTVCERVRRFVIAVLFQSRLKTLPDDQAGATPERHPDATPNIKQNPF